MSYAALTSGGKDSILAAQKAIDSGIDLKYLVCARPDNPDSYMFHSANLDAVAVIAEHAGLDYVEIRTRGRRGAEVFDLERGLSRLEIEGIVAGAIASRYQMSRLEAIASRLSLSVYAPLWQMDPVEVLREVSARMHAIMVVCAADGLDESFLGATIDKALIARLTAVAMKKGIHLAGEGGEYETLALFAPFYRTPVTYKTSRVVTAAGRSELILGGFA